MTNSESKIQICLNWWLKGLSYLLPMPIRALLSDHSKQIQIETDDNTTTAYLFNQAENILLEEKQFADGDKLQELAVSKWISQQKKNNIRTVFRSKTSEVLQKRLSLPSATRNNLRQVLGFEMDRCTPFNTEQVYFDYIVQDNSESNDEIDVDLYVIKRDRVDSLVGKMNDYQINLDGISLSGLKNEINLLPLDKRPINKGSNNNLTILLLFLCLLLGVSNLYAPAIQKQNSIAELESSLQLYRKQAVEVQDLLNEKQALLKGPQSLLDKYSSQTPMIVLLDEASKIVPDDTWLSRLTLKDKQIQLQGESDNASNLISILEASPMFKEVRFKSPTTTNPNTRKERFQLLAQTVSAGGSNE